jgi:hypothetical protein
LEECGLFFVVGVVAKFDWKKFVISESTTCNAIFISIDPVPKEKFFAVSDTAGVHFKKLKGARFFHRNK